MPHPPILFLWLSSLLDLQLMLVRFFLENESVVTLCLQSFYSLVQIYSSDKGMEAKEAGIRKLDLGLAISFVNLLADMTANANDEAQFAVSKWLPLESLCAFPLLRVMCLHGLARMDTCSSTVPLPPFFCLDGGREIISHLMFCVSSLQPWSPSCVNSPIPWTPPCFMYCGNTSSVISLVEI